MNAPQERTQQTYLATNRATTHSSDTRFIILMTTRSPQERAARERDACHAMWADSSDQEAGEGEQCVRAICMWPEMALSLFGGALGWLFWVYIACGVVIGRPRLLPLLCCLTLSATVGG